MGLTSGCTSTVHREMVHQQGSIPQVTPVSVRDELPSIKTEDTASHAMTRSQARKQTPPPPNSREGERVPRPCLRINSSSFFAFWISKKPCVCTMLYRSIKKRVMLEPRSMSLRVLVAARLKSQIQTSTSKLTRTRRRMIPVVAVAH